ncbi:MAG: hypothetical protein AAFR21_17820 [Pseudomonadota bacterium]
MSDSIGRQQPKANKMADKVIVSRILKFMRQMNSHASDETLRQAAVRQRWISEEGCPTEAGRHLVSSFDELQEVTQSYMQ